MISKIFPFILYLHILQLEDYKISRFLGWVRRNFFVRSTDSNKKLIWTQKARHIFAASLLWSLASLVYLFLKLGFVGIVLWPILLTQSYFFIILGALTKKPFDLVNRVVEKGKIRDKISELKKNGLVVIGITGSYGKTSVKEYLYEMLKQKFKVLRTPESFNTLWGIRDVIDYELDDLYQFFICEMGAYHEGEILEICDMVLPDHAILTGINEQHLERFGRIENTIRAKFELIQSVLSKGLKVINGSNQLVTENFKKFTDHAEIYSENGLDFGYFSVKFSPAGTDFKLTLRTKTYNVHTKLLGTSAVQNITAAASMAFLLGVEPELILTAISNLNQVPHRLQISRFSENVTLIDDGYSSNVTGFKQACELVKSFADQKRIIATPGIVELGSMTQKIHEELGLVLAQSCDEVWLVGQNPRTLSLQKGIDSKVPVKFANNTRQVFDEMKLLSEPTIVLIENDLPDNYL